MRHLAAFLLLGVVLWWLWQLLAGEWSSVEWVAGGAGAVVAAAIGELAATRAQVRASLPLRILAGAPSALGMVLVDFAIVMWALVVRREGVFRTTAFAHPDDERFRAWATILGDYSPNAYVVDISGGKTVTHHMLPLRRSQEPA